MKRSKFDVIIIGGGIIGLSIAWRLARVGLELLLVERKGIGEETSSVAAGMLAPYSELGFENEDMLELGERSLREYPRFLEELSHDSGISVPLHDYHTLMCGVDSHDIGTLKRRYDLHKNMSIESVWVSPGDVRSMEPLLSPRTLGALKPPTEAFVDPQQLMRSLHTAILKLGGEVRTNLSVTELIGTKYAVEGVAFESKDIARSECVVLATGAWTSKLYPACGIRSQKGQILTVELPKGLRLRSLVRTPRVYITPTNSSTLRLGATTEECGMLEHSTAGALYKILHYGREIIPSLDEASFHRMDVGYRPTTPSHRPILGPAHEANLILAGGHHRGGVLLAPTTALAVASYVSTGAWPHNLQSFNPTAHQQGRNL